MQAAFTLTGSVALDYWREVGRTPQPDRLIKQAWDACISRCETDQHFAHVCSGGQLLRTLRGKRRRPGGVVSAINIGSPAPRGEWGDNKSPSIQYQQGFRLKNWPFSTTLQRGDHDGELCFGIRI
jgi:hypothetical protein